MILNNPNPEYMRIFSPELGGQVPCIFRRSPAYGGSLLFDAPSPYAWWRRVALYGLSRWPRGESVLV